MVICVHYLKEIANESEVRGEAKGVIEIGYEFGLSESDILERFQNKLNVPEQKAQEYLEMFGNQTVQSRFDDCKFTWYDLFRDCRASKTDKWEAYKAICKAREDRMAREFIGVLIKIMEIFTETMELTAEQEMNVDKISDEVKWI